MFMDFYLHTPGFALEVTFSAMLVVMSHSEVVILVKTSALGNGPFDFFEFCA